MVMPVLNLRLSQRRKLVSSWAMVLTERVTVTVSLLTNQTRGAMKRRETSESSVLGLVRLGPRRRIVAREKISDEMGEMVKAVEKRRK